MKIKKFLLALILANLSVQACNANETILYSVTDVSWEPYWIIEQGSASGILADFMEVIGGKIRADLQPSQPYPVKRAQMLFERGDIVIECCVNQAWRDAQDNHGASLWTETVLSTNEVAVFPAGKEFPVKQPSDLTGKQVATILGYGYVGDDLFMRNDVLNNIAQLKLVAFERVEAAIFDIHELSYLLQTHPEAIKLQSKITIGETISSSDLKIRIHSKYPELLPQINSEIRRMSKNGEISSIVKRYIH